MGLSIASKGSEKNIPLAGPTKFIRFVARLDLISPRGRREVGTIVTIQYTTRFVPLFYSLLLYAMKLAR